jgi:CMP-N-acetylneuraminic acid synthetase
VSPFSSAIQRALKLVPDGTAQPFFESFAKVRSQDLEAGYFDAGQFYRGTRQACLDGLTIHSNAKARVLPSWRVVDIDTPDDWERAEKLFQVIRSGADR